MSSSSARHGEDVVLADEDVLLTVELDLGAGVLAEEQGVADLDLERPDLAVLEHLAVADGHDLALDRLLLGGVRDDEPTFGLGLRLETLDHDPVLQRPDFHDWLLACFAWAARPPVRLSCHPELTQRKFRR